MIYRYTIEGNIYKGLEVYVERDLHLQFDPITEEEVEIEAYAVEPNKDDEMPLFVGKVGIKGFEVDEFNKWVLATFNKEIQDHRLYNAVLAQSQKEMLEDQNI